MSDIIVFDVAIGLFVIFVGGALINGMFMKGTGQNAREGVAVGAGTRRMKRSRRKKIIT